MTIQQIYNKQSFATQAYSVVSETSKDMAIKVDCLVSEGKAVFFPTGITIVIPKGRKVREVFHMGFSHDNVDYVLSYGEYTTLFVF